MGDEDALITLRLADFEFHHRRGAPLTMQDVQRLPVDTWIWVRLEQDPNNIWRGRLKSAYLAETGRALIVKGPLSSHADDQRCMLVGTSPDHGWVVAALTTNRTDVPRPSSMTWSHLRGLIALLTDRASGV